MISRLKFLCCLFLILAMGCLAFPLLGQNITKVEYFFDTDPGHGKAIDVPVATAADLTVSFTADIKSLSEGFHLMVTRAFVAPYEEIKNGVTSRKGGWSHSVPRSFYKTQFTAGGEAPANIVKGEYFVDADPGFGKANNLTVVPAADIDSYSVALPLNSLNLGFHQIFVRFVDSKGIWSTTLPRIFYKQNISFDENTLPKIVQGEYFVDKDPGFGKATILSLTPATGLNAYEFICPITEIEEGFHNLHVRFRDASGNWSLSNTRVFYKANNFKPGTSQQNIVTGEYFFDQDPGFGKANNIALTAGNDLANISFTADISALPEGFHQLFTRFKDAAGTWSHTPNKAFFKNAALPNPAGMAKIVGVEYFVDNDPGFGKGMPVAINASDHIDNLSFSIDMTEISIGNHQLYLRAKDANGHWSLSNLGRFKVDPPSSLYILIGNLPTRVCAEERIKIPFTVNQPFGSNNTFTAQLSNSGGEFSNPTDIGFLAGRHSDTILCTLPSFVGAGTAYRIRIIANSPFDTSAANSQPITISRKPEQYFSINGANLSCLGPQSYEISAKQSEFSYKWALSGGGTLDTLGTTAKVTWKSAGVHTLSLISYNNCGAGLTQSLSITVFADVPTAIPTISVSTNGGAFTSSQANFNEGSIGYQWFYKGNAISGATERTYYPINPQLGEYSVAFTNTCGMGTKSIPITFEGVKQDQLISFTLPSLISYGDAPFKVVANSTSGLPVTISRIFGPGNFLDRDSLEITGAGIIRLQGTQAGSRLFTPVTITVDVTVARATATVALSNLSKVYNGSSQTATATTVPNNLPVNFTYNNQSAAPANAGSYDVVANISSNNYQGSASGKLMIQKTGQTIQTESVSDKTAGEPAFNVASIASSGLPVSLTLETIPATGVATLSGNRITLIGEGLASLTSTQAGNNNYNAADPVVQTFQVKPAVLNDILVEALSLPSGNCTLNDSVILVVRIRNAGAQTQNSFTVGYQAVSGKPVLQTFTGSLAPKNTTIFSFNTKLGLQTGSSALKIFTILSGDERIQNDTLTVSLVRLASTTIGVSPNATICNGQSALISAFGGSAYTWGNGAASATLEVRPLVNTTYYVDITNPQGCFKKDSVLVKVQPAMETPVISDQGSGLVCFGDSVALKTSVTDSLDWFRREGNNIIALGKHLGYATPVAGEYFVKLTNSNGCQVSSALFTVKILPKVTVVASPATTICRGDSITLSVENASSFNWSTAQTSASIKAAPKTNTTYHVNGVNSAGCAYSDSIPVKIITAVAPESVTNMLPSDNSLNQDPPTNLSWGPSNNAVLYDVYLWNTTDNVPVTPLIGNTKEISVDAISGLGNSYKWQVVAKNSCFSTPGPIYSFMTSELPDLIIDSLRIPENATAGNKISLSWITKNIGRGGTGNKKWLDYVYLSQDLDLRIADDILLGKFDNLSYLNPGQSYVQTKEVDLPLNRTGTWYIFVITDNNDAFCWKLIGETCTIERGYHKSAINEASEQNNYRYKTIVMGKAPAPDLVVISGGAPADMFSGDLIHVVYKVRNDGDKTAVGQIPKMTECVPDGGKTSYVPGMFWRDAVYLSSNADFDITKAILLSQKEVLIGNFLPNTCLRTSDTLRIDSTYGINAEVAIPQHISGTYYLHVMANQVGLIENFYTNNFFTIGPINIRLTPPADLVPKSITLPPTAVANETLALQWKVMNEGANKPIAKSWEDRVYLSNSPTFNSAKAIYTESVRHTDDNNLPKNGQYESTLSFKVPRTLSGPYYIYVQTDAANEVFEYNKDDNNLLRSTLPVTIGTGNRSDLRVSNINLPDTITRTRPFPIKYTIHNTGKKNAEIGITDHVYFSETSNYDPGTAILIGSLIHKTGIEAGLNLAVMFNVTLPEGKASSGKIFVITDVKDDEFEENENNNRDSIAISGNIPFVRNPAGAEMPDAIGKPVINLAMSGVNYSGTPKSGQNIEVTIRVANLENKGSSASWNDVLYLSRDSALTRDDYYLNQMSTNAIGASATYSRTFKVTLPEGIEGNWVLIAYTDKDLTANDTARQNNIGFRALNVSLSPVVDLAMTQIQTISGLLSGQRLKLGYTVSNISGNDIGESRKWTDAAYICKSPSVISGSAGCVLLGTAFHDGGLMAGASYTDSILAILPLSMNGNYYLVFVSDYINYIYEHNSEHNNEKASYTTLSPPSPSDLLITKVIIPEAAILGDKMTSSFVLKNKGSNPAVGNLTDAIYLSQDQLLSPLEDVLFKSMERNIYMQPGEEITVNTEGPLRTVQPGGYFAVAKTNTNNQIPEGDITNNTGISENKVNISVRNLLLEVPLIVSLNDDETKYYKVNVPGNLDLVIDLASNKSLSTNELYVSFDKVPTPLSFNFAGLQAQKANQRIIIPETQEGNYYLMAQSPFDGGGQRITLLAKALPFGINTIAPSRVGQGIVSTYLEGAGFREGVSFELRTPGSSTVVATAIKAGRTTSMQASPEWDLTTVPLGKYDVVAVNKDGRSAILSNGMTVEVSSGFKLDYFAAVPDLIRLDKNAFYNITIKNVGNIDIPFVNTEVGIPMSLSINSIKTAGNLKTRQQLNTIGSDTLSFNDFITIQNSKIVPLLSRNLKAGENATVSMMFSNFSAGTFSLNLRVSGNSREEFVTKQFSAIEQVRQMVLNNDYPYKDSLMKAIAPDKLAFRNLLLGAIIRMQMINAEDTIGLSAAECAACGLQNSKNPGITYNPGFSPGFDILPSGSEFGAGQVYLWEINDYNGTAGASPGWDLLKTTGTLRVTATSANPFVIKVTSLLQNNNAGYLANWWPGVDTCWPIAIAGNGILDFDSSKFSINLTDFTTYNNLYGGSFSVKLSRSGDSLMLCFKAAVPLPGQPGIPGGRGGIGQPGTRGGTGGPGNGIIPPGPGGQGGTGGPGNGLIPPGAGGAGGAGGFGGFGQIGGIGGYGGPGGAGVAGMPGGPGGQGGPGGTGGTNASGGTGGFGGPGGPGGPGAPGGDGGKEGPGGPGPNGPGEPGQPGPAGPTGPPSDPGNPNDQGSGNQFGGGGGFGGGTGGGFDGGGAGGGTGGGIGGAGAPGNCNAPSSSSIRCELIPYLVGCALPMINCYTLFVSGGASAGAIGVGVGFFIGAAAGALVATYVCSYGVTQCFQGETTGVGKILKKLICRPVVASCDPNEMQGPPGYGAARMVAANATLPYTILYENDPTFATIAAQRVKITQKLDPNFDINSFRVGDFGFGPYIFNVPEGLSKYTASLDLPDSVSYDVNATAGIDIVNQELFWIFQTIDPATGLSPNDPFAGFLQVNDSSKRGEGFVTYTISPQTGTRTGDSIKAKAAIVFDINAPIETNEVYNIIDARAPVSQVLPNVEVEHNSSITMNVLLSDDDGGSGVNHYNMYVSENGGPFVMFDSLLTAATVTYTGTPGNTYCFYSSTADHVMNSENQKNSCELSVTLKGGTLPVSWLHFNGWQQQDDIQLQWSTGNEENVKEFVVERSADGINFIEVARVKAKGNSSSTTGYSFTDANAGSLPTAKLYYRLRKLDTDGSASYSVTLAIPLRQSGPRIFITAFPNPFTNDLQIQVAKEKQNDLINSVELLTMQGKQVYLKTLQTKSSNTLILKDLPALPAGLYLLRTYISGIPYTIKVSRK